MTGAPRKRGRKDDSFAQVLQVGIDIMSNSISQASIKLNPKVILLGPKLGKTLLLSDGPRFTNILLKEFSRKEKMVGIKMCGANVKAITKILCQGNKFSIFIIVVWLCDLILLPIVWNSRMPLKLPSWKKKDITQ